MKEMTGRNYTVVSDLVPDCSIKLQVESGVRHDGFRIHREGETICIGGGSSRGCLYGTYAFLHELGCRWSLPGKEYEIVPKVKKIAWSGSEMKSEPAIRRRGMVYTPLDVGVEKPWRELVDFMAKNGFNFLFVHAGCNREDMVPGLIDSLSLREMGFEFGGHMLPGCLPRDMFKDHPEYFRMEGGKRTPELNMCPSSPAAVDIVAGNAEPYVEFIHRFSDPEMLHLWPDDLFSGGWCSCEKCAALSDPDQALKIMNQVAERLRLGDAKLAYLAYHNTLVPPKQVSPSDRVRLFYAPRERCYRHAMGECEANRRYLRHFTNLAKAIPREPEVFEYYQDCVLFRLLPVPLHPIVGKDVEAYRKAGMDGLVTHHFETFSNWAYGLNSYVLGKALWRGSGSPRDVEEYCNDIYGTAGKSMKEYFDMLFELTATAMQTCGYMDGTDLQQSGVAGQRFAKSHADALLPLISDEHLDKIEAKLSEASDAASEPYRSRIEEQRILFGFARLEMRNAFTQLMVAVEYNDYAMRAGATDADRLQAIARIEALLTELVQGMNRANAVFDDVPNSLKGPYDPIARTWWDAAAVKRLLVGLKAIGR